jgi:hypothetical protein
MVNTFPWHEIIVGDIVFSAVHVISKETRQIILPRIPCLESTANYQGTAKNCRPRGKTAAEVLDVSI